MNQNQDPNRLAHLYFLRERLKRLGRPAWLINLYFLDDPIGPVNKQNWQIELKKVKAALGLTREVPYAFELFLPALNDTDASIDEAFANDHEDDEIAVESLGSVVSRSGDGTLGAEICWHTNHLAL